MFDSIVNLLLRTIVALSFKDTSPYDFRNDRTLHEFYDFIVVGGGVGGSVVSARLAETGATVLLLEAGTSAPPESAVPGLTVAMYGGDNDWIIKGAPQHGAQMGYEKNASTIIQGKVMGGTSSMNGMLFTRGSPQDYDHWSRQGNYGWDYQSLLPYFKKIEDYRGYEYPYTDYERGRGGPVSLELRKTNTKLSEAMLKAATELHYNIIDGTGQEQIGFMPYLSTVKDGVRMSASEAYLRPAAMMSNLHIKTSATVTRVLFGPKKDAIGVEYVTQSQSKLFGKEDIGKTTEYHKVYCTREVILSAGALNTPKLLLLSGVGPLYHLHNMKIPIVATVEGVGRNLQDHPNIYLTWAVKRGTSIAPSDIVSPRNFIEYAKHRQGMYADTPGAEMNAFLNIGGDEPAWPDLQIYMTTISFALDGGATMGRILDFKSEAFKDVYGPYFAHSTMTLACGVSRPKSRGTVTLASSDYRDNPVVDPNYFQHEEDLKLLVKGIRMAQKIANTNAVQEILQARIKPSTLRYCKKHSLDSDAYWECYVRHLVNSFWHFSGTAKMAPLSDPLGVVDHRLKVRGVTGLRVVDASIIPTIPSANIQAAVYMIGEKAADLIKEDWGFHI